MELLSLNVNFIIFAFLSSKCTEICGLEAETGPGKAMIMRFFYDKSAGECKEFVYGGARGNANNFKTQEECIEKCKGQ